MLEVEDIPDRYRQMVATSDGGNLAIRHAHREPEFPAITHQLAIEARRGFVVAEHPLIKSQGNKSFESLAQAGSAFAIRQDTKSVGDLTDGNG